MNLSVFYNNLNNYASLFGDKFSVCDVSIEKIGYYNNEFQFVFNNINLSNDKLILRRHVNWDISPANNHYSICVKINNELVKNIRQYKIKNILM